ncbi:hypothetical protein B0H19DRAFT_1063299 [Mycena capillaripes]|nr:hypothetical protein B0H19DRAFT_1063299 [Mycena capillaripes]
MKIPRKVVLDRMARNGKRVERREAKEEKVSEDEADKLAPYTVIAPPSSAEGPTGSRLFFEDHSQRKTLSTANDNSIPAAIHHFAKKGTSLPLTLFLPTSLETRRSSNFKTVKHGTGDSRKSTIIDISEFPDKKTLDPAVFLTCYNSFLTFLELTEGIRIFQGLALNYNNILGDPGFQA